jgi:hypothetical protein
MGHAAILLVLGVLFSGWRRAALVLAILLLWMMAKERRPDLKMPRR